MDSWGEEYTLRKTLLTVMITHTISNYEYELQWLANKVSIYLIISNENCQCTYIMMKMYSIRSEPSPNAATNPTRNQTKLSRCPPFQRVQRLVGAKHFIIYDNSKQYPGYLITYRNALEK